MVPFASYVSRGQSKPYKRINGPIVGMLLFFQLICMICGREGHGAECMVRAQKLHSEQRSFLLPWLHSRIPGADGKAPGYRLSPDHFQTVNRMLAPDWAQKMLCIIVPNRQTHLLSSFRVFVHEGYCLDHGLFGSCTREMDAVRKLSV